MSNNYRYTENEGPFPREEKLSYNPGIYCNGIAISYIKSTILLEFLAKIKNYFSCLCIQTSCFPSMCNLCLPSLLLYAYLWIHGAATLNPHLTGNVTPFLFSRYSFFTEKSPEDD